MKGTEAFPELITFIGVIVIGMLVISVYTSQTVVPGIKAAELVEQSSLASAMQSIINTLSTTDSGKVTKDFVKEHRIRLSFVDGKNYIFVDDVKLELATKVKPTDVTSKKVLIEKLPDDDSVGIKAVKEN